MCEVADVSLDNRFRMMPWRRCALGLQALAIAGMVFLTAGAAPAATVWASTSSAVPCSDPVARVTALVDAINAANGSGGGTINLAPGCTYTLTAANNSTDGGNGLPVITGAISLIGSATITRSADAPNFRILDVASGGRLTLNRLTISGGNADSDGGGINNRGSLTVFTSTISSNTSFNGGGGVSNDGGKVTVYSSTISKNFTTFFGGGLSNVSGAVTIYSSAITHNSAGFSFFGFDGFGGGIYTEGGTVTLNNSMVSANLAHSDEAAPGGGIYIYNASGNVKLRNSQVATNQPDNCAPPGAVPGCSG